MQSAPVTQALPLREVSVDETSVVTAPADMDPLRRRAFMASVEIVNGSIGGSGTIIHVEDGVGLVLTCAHLFPGGAKPNLSIRIPGRGKRVPAKLIERDGKYDLAAMHFEAAPDQDFVPLSQQPAGRTSNPPGMPLFQFGYPVGHRGQDGPHNRVGVMRGHGWSGYWSISSGLVSGDSGGGVFRAEDGLLVGVGVHGNGGFVGVGPAGEFANRVCWPFLKRLLDRIRGGKKPDSPKGPQGPKSPDMPEPKPKEPEKVQPPAVDLKPLQDKLDAYGKRLEALEARPVDQKLIVMMQQIIDRQEKIEKQVAGHAETLGKLSGSAIFQVPLPQPK